jgi:two-component system LytT family response regulator
MNVIKNSDTNVILTTAYSSYALEGYTYDILDFLLKPITFERFLIAVSKVQKRKLHDHQSPVTPTIPQQYIFVKTEYRVQKVMLSTIFYIEGLGDYVTIHTSEGKMLSLERLKNLEDNLPAHNFLRIHKSFIINTDHINFIEKGRIVINGEYLPVGESYKERMRSHLGFSDGN